MPEPIVIGIDPSIRSLGLATAGYARAIVPPKQLTGYHRHLHLADVIADAIAWNSRDDTPTIVALEGYSLGSPGRKSLVLLGELGGIIRATIVETLEEQTAGGGYAEIPPASLKRWATGNGAARKPAMIAAAARLGAGELGDDAADAYLLRRMALAHYTGHHPDGTDPDALAGVTWPTITTDPEG